MGGLNIIEAHGFSDRPTGRKEEPPDRRPVPLLLRLLSGHLDIGVDNGKQLFLQLHSIKRASMHLFFWNTACFELV